MSVWNNPQPNDGYFAAAILANELLDPADVGPCLEKLLCHNFSRNKEVAATQSKDFVRRWADACQQFEKVSRGQDQNWDWEDEAEVKEALLHIDRAVQLGHAVRDGSDSVLTIGHSPEADQAWVSAILAIRLPLYPKLRIQFISEFSSELVRSVMAGELNLALVTAALENSQITTAAFAQAPLYAALPQIRAAAQEKDITLQDLAKDDWILFARRARPVVHDAIMEAARREGIAPKHAHDIHTAQQAVHLASEHVGVAILTKSAVAVGAQG